MDEYSRDFGYGSAKITIIARFEEDYEEIRFIHPLTGQECESYQQAMQGWSEQSEEDSAEWTALGDELHKIGEDLGEWISNEGPDKIFKEATN